MSVCCNTGIKCPVCTDQQIYIIGLYYHVESLPDAGNYCRYASSYIVPILLIFIRMLWTIAVVILILWLLGFNFHVGGNLIHTLLVIVVILVLVQLIS